MAMFTGMLRIFDARFMAPAPATRLAALRLLVGAFATVFLIVRAPYVFDLAGLPAARFEAVGLLWWLTSPLPVAFVYAVVVAGVLAAVAATVGWCYRVSGPLAALLFLFIATYENSWQHVAHTENLVTLHLLVLGFAPAAEAWSLDCRRGRVHVPSSDEPRFGWPVRMMAVITVLTYVVAGIAKQRNGGFEWITGDVLRNQVANDNLRKIVLGDLYSPFGGWLVQYGWAFPPMALATMVIELGAPLALLRGKVRFVLLAGMWFFHLAILIVMAIMFIYPLTGIAYTPLLRPERLPAWVAGRWQRRRTPVLAVD